MARSPWMERVYRILSTRGPQPIDTLVSEAGPLIPPGYAYREREKSRKYVRSGQKALPPDNVEVTDEAIWAGRRRLIYKGVWSAVRDGPLELFDGSDGRRWARLNPGFRRKPHVWQHQFNAYVDKIMTPADRSAAIKKAWETRRLMGWKAPPVPEAKRELSRKLMQALPFEERSRRARLAASHMTPEQKKAIKDKIFAGSTPEQRSEWSRRANASQTPEQRHQRAMKAAASMTPEQRHERAVRAGATRRANAAAKANGSVDPPSD